MYKQFILLIGKGVCMFTLIRDFLYNMMEREDEGQGLVEYAIIIALIVIVVIVALSPLGEQIAAVFTEITTELGGAVGD